DVLRWTGVLKNDGTVTFDPATNTLTLDNAYIEYRGSGNYGGICNTDIAHLTIRVKGACTIHDLTHNNAYPTVYGEKTDLTITGCSGTDTLNIIGPPIAVGTPIGGGLWKLTLKELVLDIDGYTNAISLPYAEAYIDHAVIIMRQAGNYLSNGEFTFCDGWGFVYPEGVTWNPEQLYMDAEGNRIKTPYYAPYSQPWEKPAPVTAVIRSLDEPLQKYDLYVGGKQVHEFNLDDILGDGNAKATYAPSTKTLTLGGGDYILGQGGSSAGAKQFGICSYIDGLTIAVTDTTYVNQSLSPSASKVAGLGLYGNTTVTGRAALVCGGSNSGITVGYSSALTVDGDVTLTGMGGQYGIQGGTRTESGIVLFNAGLTVRGGATVRARGTKQSLYGFQDFVLKDGHAITSPEGAVWNTWHHDVSEGPGIYDNSVKDAYVVIAAPANRYDLNSDGAVDVSDVTLLVGYVLSPDGTHDDDYNLNGDTGVDISDVTELVSAVMAGAQ
ncbi:MAG: hypothetical protein IJ729_07670, partial [Alloprevotella sp.]|nr:hypothetical protein [Alloprevotella sp.]